MKKLTDNQSLVLSIAGALLATFGFGFLLSMAPTLTQVPLPTATPGGIPASKYQQQVPDFTLTDQDGRSRSLSGLRGRPVLISFGYTHCPDVCPLTLADFKLVKKQLGADAENVTFLFISLDPGRDSAEVIKRYLALFDTSFIGMTGDSATIDAITDSFDASYQIQKPAAGKTDYSVAHTSFTYLLDQNGLWRLKFPFQTPPAIIADDVRKLLASKSAPL